MVVRILLAIMVAQVVCALLIWYAATAYVPADLALVLALLAVVLVRLAITANNFLLSRRHGSATPAAHRLTAGARLRVVLAEFRATMLTSSWHMLRHRPAPFLAPGGTALPVLLVHGYGANGGYWHALRRLLRAQGISHDAVDLEPVTAAIDDYAGQVEDGVARLLAATGAPRVVIVAHSMGGLVTRAWLRRHGAAAEARVARVITLGTPHFGTALAALGIGANAAQMRRGAPWLAQLDRDDRCRRALITSIWTWHDNIIAPQASCQLPGARNVALGGIGHVALGSHPQVLRTILDEILTASKPSARLY
ncbi:esterase/lipase family protein [Pseudoduganella chitinolytica]|uniref:Alpha/beta fold hydrolase n=1 Tax=Pseudoduganella chitinolytica TaxID=34070 RepID=A0ABY8BHL9_9BURK|nr:alpha/beta fold hydrolase [Pseudoduganella chitinolytica]WEF35399.1 alpha/beta fold hydrolase [Pseudoduganella chitinolytica]